MRIGKKRDGDSGSGLTIPLCVGDLVFIQVSALPFRRVARATGSWTNHVGVVIDVDGREPVIAESRFPLSCTTSLSRFIGRSEGGRVAVTRLKTSLTEAQKHRLRMAANRRLGIFYDSGFNLHSRRQFCSRYVREVVGEATGTSIGEVETFATLLSRQPHSSLGFWRLWYFGRIPWDRETVSPANLLRSSELTSVFDGVAANRSAAGDALGRA
jgi:Permuted papain-like amidase enzyme, YaeF/YiiX, C92 family